VTNETIEANTNFALAIICSKTYPSHKPDSVIISVSDVPNLTPQEKCLPFYTRQLNCIINESGIYIFGGSSKNIKEENYIERSINKNQNNFIQNFSNEISMALLLGFIVDKRIELTYALIQFHERLSNNPVYWKDKKVTLIIGDTTKTLKHVTKEYFIRGDVHNVPYIKIRL